MYINNEYILFFSFFLIFLSLSLTFFMAVQEVISSKPINSAIGYYIVFLMFLLIAFRTRGWDVEQYYNIYASIKTSELSFHSWQEPGFMAINYIFKYMGAPYFVYNLFISMALSIIILLSVKANSYYVCVPFLFIFLFYFYRGPYGQIRQAFSIFCFLYSLRYLTGDKQSFYKFYTLNALCMFIHYISFMAFFTPFFRNIIVTRTRLLIYALIIFITGWFSNSLRFIFSFDFFQSIPGCEKIIYYINRGDAKGSLFNLDTFVFLFVFLIIFFLLGKRRVISLHVNIFMLGVFIYFALSFDLLVASRISSMYTMVFVFIISGIISSLNLSNRVLIFIFSYCVGLYYLLNEFDMLSKGTITYG